jgi:hypothetical protein
MALGVIITDRHIEQYAYNLAEYFKKLSRAKGSVDPVKRNVKGFLPSGVSIKHGVTRIPNKYSIAQQSIFNALMKQQSFVKLLKEQISISDQELDSNNLPPVLLESIYKDLEGKELIKLAVKHKELKIILESSEEIPVTTIYIGADRKFYYSTILLKGDKLKEKFLEARVDGSTIRVSLSEEGAATLLKAFAKANELTFKDNAKNIAKDLGAVTHKHVPTIKDLYLGSIRDSINTDRALSEGKITHNRNKYKGGKMLSLAQFSALVRKAVIDDSPKGPLRGPALGRARGVLTIRTGRYVNSIRVTSINIKNQMIRYIYHPIYLIHEPTVFKPSKHIGKHIRELAKQVYGFNAKPVLR